MFAFAVITAIFGNLIFFLGISGYIYSSWVGVLTVVYCGALFYVTRGHFVKIPWHMFLEKKFLLILFLLFCLALINAIGTLGPETAFDALWYHLTFPKLYILEHTIHFFPGGLLAYSVMPKFGELLFTPAMLLAGETGAKCVQYVFGILTTVGIYKVSRRYVSSYLSLIACLVFYSCIVVAWESTAAYIDLVRAFYEVMALYAFTIWVEKKQRQYLVLMGICVGTAASIKILAIGSVFLLASLVLLTHVREKKHTGELIHDIGLFGLVSMLCASPWLLLSYLSTGNPFYPIFTPILTAKTENNFHSLYQIIHDIVQLFFFADDPISPIYGIVFPLFFLYYKKFSAAVRNIIWYCLGALLFWFITPRTGGGRFILPYLPIWSLLVVIILEKTQKNIYYKVLIPTICLIAIITIGYRGIANIKYLPVILGHESKASYLTTHLNFSFGDFYDTDGYFASHIKPTEKVLLFGFHNLYYVDFPFIDSSYVKRGDTFMYVATQHTNLPARFQDWKIVYNNPMTFVRLYKKGNHEWVY